MNSAEPMSHSMVPRNMRMDDSDAPLHRLSRAMGVVLPGIIVPPGAIAPVPVPTPVPTPAPGAGFIIVNAVCGSVQNKVCARSEIMTGR